MPWGRVTGSPHPEIVPPEIERTQNRGRIVAARRTDIEGRFATRFIAHLRGCSPSAFASGSTPGWPTFWAAVLGYERRAGSPDEDLVDPRLRGPSIWFQHMDAPRPQRNRFHIDLWVPPELAEARVAAALAAGGRMVRDASPTWWTLADAEGNEVDVTSAAGRD